MVEKDNDVAVFHDRDGNARIRLEHYRCDKFIRNAAQKRIPYRRPRVVSALAFGMCKHREGSRRTLPILAAVHRKKSPAQSCDPADTDVRHFDFECLDINICGSRRYVSPVEYAVNKNFANTF